MAVTDMTGSLPWWARGGSPQSQGPEPPQGVDPQAWLTYLSSMFGPGSAQAAEPDINSTLNSALAARAPGPPAPDERVTPPVAPAAPIASQTAAPAGGGGYGGLGPQGWGVTAPNGGYNSGVKRTDAAYGPYDAPPAAAAQPVAAAAPGGGNVTVRPRAAVPGPMAQGANNRFIGIDAPNFSPQNSMRAGPQGTALNLAGLFGGGQGAAAPAAAAPAAAPTGSSPGMRIVNGPLAAPPGRTQMTPDQLAAAVRKPNWWQSLGRPDMTPDQLASAVKKPNWYRNV